MTSLNFEFLRPKWPQLAELGGMAEVGDSERSSSRIWDDANTPSTDWFQRHRRLGAALQSGLAGKQLPTLKRKPKVGEFAFWVVEPGLPRLVRALSGDKVTLFEPGADDVSGRKIAAAYLNAIDLDAIVASVAMA